MIQYGCCVGDWDEFRAYSPPDRPIIVEAGHTSIAQAYNLILDATPPGSEALILLHTDLAITDPDGEAKLIAPLTDPDVALVGVAGARNPKSLAWWEADTVGHQLTDVGMIDFGARSGDVDILEGSIMVLSPWVIEHFRFDTLYPGFHGYDEIGPAMRAAGKRVVVVDVDTHHHTQTGFKSEQSARDWQAANVRFRKKWITS